MSDQRHVYDYTVQADAAGAKVVRMVGAGKRVLELGPGPGAITRLLANNGCRVTAVEFDADAIRLVSEHCEQVWRYDLNETGWFDQLFAGERFPVVVAADVLEHLYDPWLVLRRVRGLLAPDGQVVVSLPHVAHSAVLACLLLEDFEYQPWGLLDRTHIRFFGMHNIQRLFEDAGFKIVEADFVVRSPEQTEFANRWRKLPRALREQLGWNRFGNVYQVVIRAVPAESRGERVLLNTLAVSPPVPGAYSGAVRGNRLLSYLISFLSLKTRARISQLLHRLGLRR